MDFQMPLFKLFKPVCLKFTGLLLPPFDFNIDVVSVYIDKDPVRPASLGQGGYFEGDIPEFLSIFDSLLFCF